MFEDDVDVRSAVSQTIGLIEEEEKEIVLPTSNRWSHILNSGVTEMVSNSHNHIHFTVDVTFLVTQTASSQL